MPHLTAFFVEVILESDFRVRPACFGEKAYFIDLSTSGDSTFIKSNSWTLGNGDVVVDTNLFGYLYGSPGTYEVTLTNITDYGCEQEITKLVDVYPVPEINLPNDTAICTNTTLTYNLPTEYQTMYFWSPDTHLIFQEPSTYTFYPNDSIQYTLQVVNEFGCAIADTMTIDTLSTPNIIAIPESDTVVIGESLQLEASGGYIYEWVSDLWLDDPFSPTPTTTPLDNIVYVVHGEDENGCMNSDTVHIYIKNEIILWIPNAIKVPVPTIFLEL